MKCIEDTYGNILKSDKPQYINILLRYIDICAILLRKMLNLTFGSPRRAVLMFIFAIMAIVSPIQSYAQIRQMPSIVIDVRDNLQIVRPYNNGAPFQFSLTLNSLVNTAEYAVSEMDCSVLPHQANLLSGTFDVVTTAHPSLDGSVVLSVDVTPTVAATPGTYCFGVYAIDRSGICVSDIYAFSVTLIEHNAHLAYTNLITHYDSLFPSYDTITLCNLAAVEHGYTLPLHIDTAGFQPIYSQSSHSMFSYWWTAQTSDIEVQGLREQGYGYASADDFLLNISDTLLQVAAANHSVITYTVGAAYKAAPDARDSIMLNPYTFTVIVAPETHRELLAYSTAQAVCGGQQFTITFADLAGLELGNGFGIRLHSNGVGCDVIDTFLYSASYTHTVVNDVDIPFTYYLYDSLTACQGMRYVDTQTVHATAYMALAVGTDYVLDSIEGSVVYISRADCPGERLLINPAALIQATHNPQNAIYYSWYSDLTTGITYHDTINPLRGSIAYMPNAGTFVNTTPAADRAIHYLDRDNMALNNDQEAYQQYRIYTSLMAEQADGMPQQQFTAMAGCSIIDMTTNNGVVTIYNPKIEVNVNVKPKPGLQLRFGMN